MRSPGPSRRPRRRSTIPLTWTWPFRIHIFAWPPVAVIPAHLSASPRVIFAVKIRSAMGTRVARALPVDSDRSKDVQILRVIHRPQHTRAQGSRQLEKHLGGVHVRQRVQQELRVERDLNRLPFGLDPDLLLSLSNFGRVGGDGQRPLIRTQA